MNEAALFGQLVRTTRKARKLSLGQVAEKADTGIKHLGRIERGEKQPSFELIVALAKAMNVSPSVFFEFEDVQADERSLKTQIRNLIETGKIDKKRLSKARRILGVILEP